MFAVKKPQRTKSRRTAKDIAVEYMLGEPDRLLKEFAAAKDELAKTRAKPVRTHFDGNLPNGTPPFSPTEEMKASFVTGCERTVLLVEKKLEEAKAGDISIPRLLNPDDEGSLEDCRVGKVGTIILRSPPYNYSLEATIYQIIDKNRMLVRLEQRFQSFRDIQNYTHSKIVLAKMPTEGHTDNQKLSFDRPVVVSGTYQYETTVGTRTVLVFEQIDPEWLKAEVEKRLPPSNAKRIGEALATAAAERKAEADKKAAEADRRAAELRAAAERAHAAVKAEAEKKAAEEKAEADRRAAVEEAKWRTWTDSTGQFTTKAKFGGMAGGKVKLIKKDGSTVRLPLNTLSQEDQDWINKKFRRKAAPVVATEKPDAEESHVVPEKPDAEIVVPEK